MCIQHKYNLALNAFRMVAEQKNFTKAAAKLGVSPSALSQTIRQLEDKLKIRLFNRTTRSVGLTEAGQNLLTRTAPLLDEIEHIFDELKQEQDLFFGPLKLTMPYIVWQTIICPILPKFIHQYPKVLLDIHISDGLIDITREGFDGGIRLDDEMHQDMVAFPINSGIESIIVGSPDYFRQHAKPQHPDDLKKHTCINYRFQTSGTLCPWTFHKDNEVLKLSLTGMALTEEVAIVQAAKAGLGLAYVFTDGIKQELANNKLMPVLTDWSLPKATFYFYYPSRHHHSAKLKAFIEFLKKTCH